MQGRNRLADPSKIEMYRLVARISFALAVILAVARAVRAEDFAIQIASPVAAQNYQMKRSTFVFRTTGCAAAVPPEVMATAEGRVTGQRRSLPLKVVVAPATGVYGVFREWPEEGVWIVNVTARCASTIAGALVATDGKSFIRESSVFLTHKATEAEIEAALKGTPRK
jgi:hypothetical protein